MMMAEHTPTPWEVFDHGRLLVVAPGSGWSVFEIAGMHPTERPYHEANAAFIVKAVNLHDELVALVAECRKQINAIIEDGAPTDWRMWRDDLARLLAKAEA